MKNNILKENHIYNRIPEELYRDAYDRLIAPAIEREIRSSLTEKAEEGLSKYLERILAAASYSATYRRKVVLGWDPAFSTGCKLAVVDPTGKVLATKVIYPTAPHNKVEIRQRIR